MGWHYGVVRTVEANGDDVSLGVCEVYEFEGDTCWSPSVKPYGETVEELIMDLERMLSDVREYNVIYGDLDE